jgi:hypothetical protein
MWYNDDRVRSPIEQVPVPGETLMPWDILGGIPIPPEMRDKIISALSDPEEPDIWESTAYHEAGHAVAAVLLNVRFSLVGMENHIYTRENQENLGGIGFDEAPPHRQPDFDPGNPGHRQAAANLVVVALAGEASQSFLEERECDIRQPSAEGDYELVLECANLLHADLAARAAFIEDQERAACKLVREPSCGRRIKAVADTLRLRKRMSYSDVVNIMNNTTMDGEEEAT